jgi:hypothetical protein
LSCTKFYLKNNIIKDISQILIVSYKICESFLLIYLCNRIFATIFVMRNNHCFFGDSTKNIIIISYMKSKHIKQTITTCLLIALISGCASSTLIQSIPNRAKLTIDGSHVGTTPYKMRDTKITGTTTSIKLESEGYEPLHTTITKDEEVNPGAVIAGIFFYIPFLWTMRYNPVHTYELQKTSNQNEVKEERTITTTTGEKIRELKRLFDEGIITEEEFEKGKRKLLE